MANIIEYAINAVDNTRGANASARAEMEKTKGVSNSVTASAGNAIGGMVHGARAALLGLTRAIATAVGYVGLIVGVFKTSQFVTGVIKEWWTGAKAFEEALNVVRERLLTMKDYIVDFGKSEDEVHAKAIQRMDERIKKIDEMNAAYEEGLAARSSLAEARGETAKIGKTPEQQARIELQTRVASARFGVEGARNNLEYTTSKSGQRAAQYDSLMQQQGAAQKAIKTAEKEFVAWGDTPQRDQKYLDLTKAEESLKSINAAIEKLNYSAITEEKRIASSATRLAAAQEKLTAAEKELSTSGINKLREKSKKRHDEMVAGSIKYNEDEKKKQKEFADKKLRLMFTTTIAAGEAQAPQLAESVATAKQRVEVAMKAYRDPNFRREQKEAAKDQLREEKKMERGMERIAEKEARAKRWHTNARLTEEEKALMGVKTAKDAEKKAKEAEKNAALNLQYIKDKFQAYIEQSTMGGN